MKFPDVHIIRIADCGGVATVIAVFLGKVIHVVAGPSETMDKLFQ